MHCTFACEMSSPYNDSTTYKDFLIAQVFFLIYALINFYTFVQNIYETKLSIQADL